MSKETQPPLPEPAMKSGPGSMTRRDYYTADQMRAYAAAAVAAERERCAKVCEAMEYSYWRSTEDQDFTPQDCADAIRAEPTPRQMAHE